MLEGVVAQVVNEAGVVVPGRVGMVAFLAAQSDRANLQGSSSLELRQAKLATAMTKMFADGSWFFCNWNSAVVGRDKVLTRAVQGAITNR